MKKITLLILAFVAFNFNYAQDTCATATVVTAGTTTVAAVDGTEVPVPECAANAADPDPRTAGEWFVYTATIDGITNVTTDLPQNAGGDTRVHIYTGSCAALTCFAGNDDIAAGNYLSDVTFPVQMGTTYYIAWDDRWSAAGFDFELTETPVDCSTTSPYTYNFADFNTFVGCYTIEDANTDGTSWGYNNGNDFDGDTVNDPVGLVFPPNPTVTKDDWLFTPAFNGVANAEYEITVVYNAFDNPVAADESFEIVVLDAPSSTAGTQSVIGSYSGITQSGAGVADLLPNAYTDSATYTPTADGTFYFAIHTTTPMATSGIFTLFSISVNETLSIPEFEANVFKHNYDKNTESLSLESSNLPLTGIEIYSILGQNVLSNTLSSNEETVNLSSLTDGVYLAKVSIEGGSQTIKFVKQ
ncbi:T9SS type A sorting domain-containing protein [Winogradskyella sp. 3972H.M.0a.05]|uniref:T9SS type A sorting domain-containing protein n=1 Tax=Winogradskyella sp. 3972H.M.0a.05 TaxID=2950277 RepID=UPI00339B30C9